MKKKLAKIKSRTIAMACLFSSLLLFGLLFILCIPFVVIDFKNSWSIEVTEIVFGYVFSVLNYGDQAIMNYEARYEKENRT